jgi:cell division protease FtsH
MGLTWFVPDEEYGLDSRNQLLARIAGLLGGREAEELIFGQDEVTTGAGNDIEKVTSIARQMVTRFGMSELGLLSLESDNSNNYLGYDGNHKPEYSDKLATAIDHQVRSIVEYCHEKAQTIIQENRTAIDRLVDILIDQETIEGEEFRQLVQKFSESGDPSLAVSLNLIKS